ncbi:uncharacterized protein PFL1_05143 [Pseudozyma flocculosa PF-1]|uniref:Nop52-domain-containing protein n=1 Tax=Pseudozyma flocculosa PF-1 TaxID=1277687 RepID=A0A061H5F4_9BASI|nr:uncharacterized protein PFL1_05143 [Pseudozyma flocculosa PF-1]EPQ27220.1 hypothetical protein PFL1_05143 [Pseudozyma flocculosa PF-1]
MPSTKRKTPSAAAAIEAPSSKKGKTASSSSSSSRPSKKAAAPPPAELPLGKALASTSKKTRDLAIRSLSSFLSSPRPAPLSPLELEKLWKGIFYCFWMSDKPLVQQDLANKLAELCLVFPKESEGEAEGKGKGGGSRITRFWNAFWRTIVREWHGVDKHRINKFLLLMRRFINAGFRLLATEQWNAEATDLFASMLCAPGAPLAVNDTKVPVSITYHVADIYLEELENAVTWSQELSSTEEEDEENEEGGDDGNGDDENVTLVPVTKLLSPFIQSATVALNKVTYANIMESVIQPFLDDTLRAAQHLVDADADDDEDDEEVEEAVASRDGKAAANGKAKAAADGEGAAAEEEGEKEEEEEEEEDDENDEAASDADSDDYPDFDSDAAGDDEDAVQYPMLLALAEPVASPNADADEDEAEDDEDDEGPLALRRAVFRLLFEAASSPSAHHSRRRKIYELWREEQDRLNALDGSGVDAVLPASAAQETEALEEGDDDEEEQDDE